MIDSDKEWQDNFHKKFVLPFEKYEIEAITRIKNKFNVELLKRCNTSKYDFKMSNKMRYEVKADLMSRRTGNFYIEYFGYGKPTGLSVTKSDFYIITDGIDYYMIATEHLQDLCKTCSKNIGTKDKTTVGYVISKTVIVNNATLI